MGLLDSTVTLSGRLVTLRPISREDYPTLFRWRSSFETVHYLNFRRRIATYEEFVRDLEMMLAGGGMLMLVRGKQSGEPIGYALAHTVNAWDGWMSGGVHVDERWRLRGHGGEATLLLIDFVFRAFPIRKLLTEVYEFAGDTLHMARALGFEDVGYIPEHFWWENRMWGLYHLVLTRERWNDNRERFADIIAIQHRFDEVIGTSTDGQGGSRGNRDGSNAATE